MKDKCEIPGCDSEGTFSAKFQKILCPKHLIMLITKGLIIAGCIWGLLQLFYK